MSAVGIDDRVAVTDLLHREVRLLDEAVFGAWIELYTADATYWVPCGLPPHDYRRQVSIVYDDYAAMQSRVERLASKFAFAQAPPSRTVRVLSNIEVNVVDGGYRARCVYVVHEVRKGRERVLPARAAYAVVNVDGGLRIQHKRIDLIASNEPLDEIGFIL